MTNIPKHRDMNVYRVVEVKLQAKKTWHPLDRPCPNKELNPGVQQSCLTCLLSM